MEWMISNPTSNFSLWLSRKFVEFSRKLDDAYGTVGILGIVSI